MNLALSKARRLAILMLFALLALGIFGRGLGHGFVAYDDPSKILNNPAVVTPGAIPFADLLRTPNEGYLIPLTVAVQAALYALGGGTAWPFHLAGLLLHLLIGWLVFRLAERLSGCRASALLSALAFFAHPLVVEPVSWATATKELLMTALALSASWLFFEEATRDAPRRGRLYGAAALGLAAMLAKPAATLLGGAWLLFLLSRRLARQPISRPTVIVATLLVAIGGAIGVASWLAHDALLLGAATPLGALDGRFFLALGYQLQHLLWPVGLDPIYAIDPLAGFSNGRAWIGAIGSVAFSATLILIRKRPRLIFGLALAGAAYLPVSNLIPFPRMVADSYLYLPLAALAIALAVALAKQGARARRVTRRICGAAIIALATLSTIQVGRWAGGVKLWQPIISRAPDWERGYGGMATYHLRRGELEPAERYFRQAFSRGYQPGYLADFAVVLARRARPDAECLLLEAVYHAGARRRATTLYNYVIHLLGQRAPRFPREAVRLIPLALDRQRALALNPAQIAELRRRLRQLSGRFRPPPPWPRRRCPALR